MFIAVLLLLILIVDSLKRLIESQQEADRQRAEQTQELFQLQNAYTRCLAKAFVTKSTIKDIEKCETQLIPKPKPQTKTETIFVDRPTPSPKPSPKPEPPESCKPGKKR